MLLEGISEGERKREGMQGVKVRQLQGEIGKRGGEWGIWCFWKGMVNGEGMEEKK